MKRWMRGRLPALLLIVACYAGITPIQRHYARQLSGPYNIDRIFRVPADPRITMAFSFGYEVIWVDLFWFRMVQYFGGNYTTLDREFKKDGYLNLANTIITLDPRFYEAYKFIAFTIIDGVKDFRRGVHYYRLAAERFPDEWFPPYMLAWSLTHTTNIPTEEDVRESIEALEGIVARDLPDMPTYVPRLLWLLKSNARDYCGALEGSIGKYMENRLTQNQADASLYQNQIQRIQLAYTQDNLRQYLAQYRIDHATDPRVISDLIGCATRVTVADFVTEGTEVVGLARCGQVLAPLARIPEDPRGGHFLYNPVEGEIQSSVDLKRVWGDQIRFLAAGPVASFKLAHARFPKAWEEFLANLPAEERREIEENQLRDGYGGRYELDPEGSGEVYHVLEADWWVEQMGPDEVIYRVAL